MEQTTPHVKVAFIGSHGVRKSTAVAALVNRVTRTGRSVDWLKEVVRYNPLGINEGATPEAQLWVLVTQVRQELELATKAEVLITDRAIIDNYAYMLRAASSLDLFNIEPFVRTWTSTYDLFIRLLPDVDLRADGVRSTSDAFRNEIESILDEIIPQYIDPQRIVTLPASRIDDYFNWQLILDRIGIALEGKPLQMLG